MGKLITTYWWDLLRDRDILLDIDFAGLERAVLAHALNLLADVLDAPEQGDAAHLHEDLDVRAVLNGFLHVAGRVDVKDFATVQAVKSI